MMCLSLEKWDNFIIDMDGVLWRGETPLSGLQEFFTALRGTKRNFVLATNNSNRTVNQYLKKLRRMGVQVSQEEILTSAQVTANHLANTAPNGSRVSVIGGDGLRTSLQEHDFEITDEIYKEFISFLSDKEYEYTTATQDALDIFKEITKEEGTSELLSEEINLLLDKIENNKKNDLENNKEEIKTFLSGEIVSRYYYQGGRIIERLKHDKDIDEALKIFNNIEEYNSILRIDE